MYFLEIYRLLFLEQQLRVVQTDDDALQSVKHLQSQPNEMLRVVLRNQGRHYLFVSRRHLTLVLESLPPHEVISRSLYILHVEVLLD